MPLIDVRVRVGVALHTGGRGLTGPRRSVSEGGWKMICPKCGTENREGAKFCKGCAAPFLGSCSNCGATIQPASKFCDQCGAPVRSAVAKSPVASTPSVRVLHEGTPAGAADGERKTVTALF